MHIDFVLSGLTLDVFGMQYSFELLLQYLHGTDSMLMLGIVNEHINIQGDLH
jgi:hypothetical protein